MIAIKPFIKFFFLFSHRHFCHSDMSRYKFDYFIIWTVSHMQAIYGDQYLPPTKIKRVLFEFGSCDEYTLVTWVHVEPKSWGSHFMNLSSYIIGSKQGHIQRRGGWEVNPLLFLENPYGHDCQGYPKGHNEKIFEKNHRKPPPPKCLDTTWF